jgi:hypothetical protein
MTTSVMTTPANISLQKLVDEYFLPQGLRSAFLMQGEGLNSSKGGNKGVLCHIGSSITVSKHTQNYVRDDLLIIQHQLIERIVTSPF